MTDIKLEIIPEPEVGTRAVLKIDKISAIIVGTGSNNYICGNCDFVLAEKINEGQFNDIVLRCPSCSSYNNMP